MPLFFLHTAMWDPLQLVHAVSVHKPIQQSTHVVIGDGFTPCLSGDGQTAALHFPFTTLPTDRRHHLHHPEKKVPTATLNDIYLAQSDFFFWLLFISWILLSENLFQMFGIALLLAAIATFTAGYMFCLQSKQVCTWKQHFTGVHQYCSEKLAGSCAIWIMSN